MSIDHGKLLALADHAAALSHRLSRMGGDSVFRAVEAREIEQGLRALVQPAEAVEGAAWTPERASRLADDCLQLAKDVEASKHDDAAQGAVAWRRDAEDLLLRLRTMQPPNVVLQQVTMLGQARDILMAALASTHPQAAPAQGDVGDDDVRAWAERHGLDGWSLTDARCAFDDARTAAPSPEPRS